VGLARFSRFVCIATYVFTCLMLGPLALAQVEAQPAATVPRLIRINGTVHDEAGKPLTGNLDLTFTLYQDQSGQSAVWQEVQNLHLDANGHFSALLGVTSEAGLPLEIFSASEARWLGIRPDGLAEQPRILLLSVAYALKAADTEMLGGRPASAYVLADSQNSLAQPASVTPAAAANAPSGAQILTAASGGVLLSPTPQVACSALTSDGTATVNQLAKFTTSCNIENSAIFEAGGNVGIGNTAPAATLDVSGSAFVRGSLTLPPVGTATPTTSFNSNPLVVQASSYNATLSRAVPYIFEWQAEPVGNNTVATSATMNLLYGVTGSVSETGVTVNNKGIISFAPGQTFPGAGGNGTVTNVATGAGLTGGPITTSGTISIPSSGVTNSMLANNSITVTAGSGLSGGGPVALGGTITLTNASPSSGGTVTSVASGTGLSGGPITGSGTLSLNMSFTDARYLQLAGGTLTAGLTGTTAAFTSGTFSSTLSAAGALLPGTGTATASKGFISNPFDLQTSSFSSSTSKAVTQDFRWQAEPTGNDTASPSGSLNLLFGSNGTSPAETGFSIGSNGVVTFAAGQTFPGAGGSGTVSSVATGAGLTGGPITSSGTITIPSAGVTNAMLANNSITVTAGSGLSGGGPVALGGTITLTNTAPSSGGTVTSVASGTGLSGGPITGSGTLSLNTSYTDARYLQLAGGTLTGGLAGTTGAFSGAVTEAGAVLPGTGTATASKGFISNPFDLQTSSFSSSTSKAVTQDFRWQAEPTANDTGSPSGSLNLLFGSNGTSPAETGFSIASNGVVTFAGAQTFPGAGGGSGTVTSINTGAGLTGGPITGSGTISIPSAGVTNAMLANPSITVTAGSGLSGGGTVALGGTITLTNSSLSSGGTVTSIATGTGLTGGPITSTGTLSLNTTFTDKRYLQLGGGTLTGALTGTTAAFTGGLAATTGAFTSTVSEAGTLLPGTGVATAKQGYNSNALDLQASSFSSTTAVPVTQDFRWQAEPTGNDSSNPSGSLNLLFGSNGTSPSETGLSIASNGLITFAPGQTFGSGGGSGGSGTVTSINTGAGLTGGPITGSGTISIPSAGVTNAMLADPSITVTAGSGLSGGGTVALGGTITLTNSSPSSGGTVTSIATGTGLTGGPITSTGTLSLNTTFTDKRYLQLAGGTLTGGLTGTTATFTGLLTGTTAAFTGGLAATTGAFTSTVSEAGALLSGTGTATAAQGYNSNALDLQASSFSSATGAPVTQDFRWQAEPTGNDSANPSGSLNLLFGANAGAPTETGLSIASNGLITFAPGQTFGSGGGGGGGGSGTVTSINTGAGLTGGPITSSGTISIPAAGVTNAMLANHSVTITAGSGLSGGGTVALGGTVTLASNLSGSTNGIAYFSNPTNVVSTAPPTNGQILIGSTGNAPVLATLTAGPNINITNSPGSVTISATGGGSAATLPFFVTGGEHTGGVQAATKNLTKLWGILLPYNVTTSQITYDVTTADNTANTYDIGIFDNSGNLVANIGPTPGTTFAPAKAFETLAWTQGSTSLVAGRYYLAFTTNCASTCAAIAASTTYISFAINASAGASTGGALPYTMTPPADVWGTGNQPAVVIH
jgi:fibronectin-binding autotransporter adhesin